jgi:predicted HTH domain antitoxin
MNTIVEIQLPPIFKSWGFDSNKIQQYALEWMVLTLFTEERISSGKAATLLNMTRLEFLDLLKKRGIAYVNFSHEELVEEFAAVDALKLQDI